MLDLGCKDGYGAHILSQFAEHIILADRNEEWLGIAKNHRYYSRVGFQIVDLEKSFPEGNYDVVVAFEVIEHVANTESLLENIADSLNEGGILVFSVPHMIENPDHKVLFDEEKIKNLISRRFKIQEFYIQNRFCISGKTIKRPEKTYVGVAIKK